MKKHRISLLAASLASLLASFTLILSPYFLGLAIDSMLGQGQVDFEGVSYYLTLTLVVYVLSFSFTSLSSLIANRVSVAIVSDLRTKVHNHLNKFKNWL